MKCYIKPSSYKCKQCVETQASFNAFISCKECLTESKKYEVLQFTDHGAILMDDNGDVFRKPFEDIRIIKREEKETECTNMK